MKRNYLLLGAAALALGLSSCQKNNPAEAPQSEAEGTAYLSVRFNVPTEGWSRAESGDYNSIGEWEGNDNIESVDIYVISEGTNTVKVFNMDVNAEREGYQTDAWLVTPGTKTVYAVVNNGGAVKNALDGATAAQFEAKYKAAYALVEGGVVKGEFASKGTDGKDKIMMTGEPANITVPEGQTKEQALATPAKVEVRRLVAQVAVSTDMAEDGENGFKVEKDGTVLGHMTDLVWRPNQFETESYLLWNGVYTNSSAVKSPKFDATALTEESTLPTEGYSYYEGDAFAVRALGEGETINATWITGEGNNLKFITESTRGTYQRGNTAYVVVEGTFVPVAGGFKTGQLSEAGYTKGTTFYLSYSNNLLYLDKDAALADSQNSEENIKEYTNGKMYYYAWINPDKTNHLEWTKSPVVRNNIYNINVKKIMNYGDNDDVIDDPEKPLNDEETYMAAEVTVMSWGMHNYNVEF